jgi:hypothetical protein
MRKGINKKSVSHTDAEIETLLRIRRDTLTALQALDGVHWGRATGELHLQYNEMPSWIELRDGDDIETAHRAFAQICEPHAAQMGPVNFTVGYWRGGRPSIFLETTAEILAAVDDALLLRDGT